MRKCGQNGRSEPEVANHMNKYADQAKAAKRQGLERVWAEACHRHKRFASPEEAYQLGMGTRRCPVCNGWHRYSLKKPEVLALRYYRRRAKAD